MVSEQNKHSRVNYYNCFLFSLKIYKSQQHVTSSESTFNHLLINKFLEAVAMSIEDERDDDKGVDFVVAEACLSSLKKQSSNQDSRYQYKADGIIRLFRMKDLELLLLEKSGHYGNCNQTKISFDHHKGVYGACAMLKQIAIEFDCGHLSHFFEDQSFLPAR